MPDLAIVPSRLTTQVHTSAEEFRSLRDEWEGLLARSRCGSAFLGFDWLAAAFTHVEEAGTRLHLITVRHGDGTLLGIAPFCIRREHSWAPRVLEFLGTRKVSSEYLDIVSDPESVTEVVDAVWESLGTRASAWDYARLSDADDDSVVMSTFRERMPAEGYRSEVQPGQTCPYLLLACTEEELIRSLGSRLRGTLRRAERKMLDLGVRLVVSDGTTALGPALDRLYELHALRWGRRGQAGKLHHPRVQGFHREVATRLGSTGGARVYSLLIGDRTIAALYGLEYKGTFFFYQSGFDPTPPNGSVAAWDYSPGVWVVSAAIRDSVRRGLREFDFLRGVEVYKTRWTPRARKTSTLILLPTNRWKGRIYHGIDTRIRRVKRRVRGWLGRNSGSNSNHGSARSTSAPGTSE